MAIVLIFFLCQTGFAQDSGPQGIVANYRQHCTITPPSADLPVIESLMKSQGEIARLDLLQSQVDPGLIRQKEIFEAQLNLAKSKCLIVQISATIGGQIKVSDMEKRAECRSMLSQLSMYQGLTNASIRRFFESEPCLKGSMEERLKCTMQTQKRHAHDQSSLNAVEFFIDVYQLALKRNPELTVLELGKVMEKRFENDIRYLKNLPEPDEEDSDDSGDNEVPPMPTADDLIPAAVIK